MMRRLSSVLAIAIAVIAAVAAPVFATPHQVFLHAPGDQTALVGGCTGQPASSGRSGIQCTEGTWARYTIIVSSQSGKTEKRLAIGPALGVEYVGPGCSYPFGTGDPAVRVAFRVLDGDSTNGRIDGVASYTC